VIWSHSTLLLLISCGAGISLGLHFNILVVLPFSILGVAAFFFSSWSSGQSLFGSTGLLLVSLISVQASFVLGLTARETCGQLLARLKIGQSRQI
jgi:protein-S-isoprenylcysteine O-methyltransferase Ste14